MTELEQYRKAYATLVGRVDTVIKDLGGSSTVHNLNDAVLTLVAASLIKALHEAEDVFVSEDPEPEGTET